MTRLSFRAEDPRRASDISRYMLTMMAPQADYRCLVVGDEDTVEFRRDYGHRNPWAVYPTWNYQTDKLAMLEELCTSSIDAPEHRISIVNLPLVTTGLGRAFYRTLGEIQRDYPEAILHLHGLDSYRLAFGFGFASVDIDPMKRSVKSLVLPNGRVVGLMNLRAYLQWISVLGFSIPALTDDSGARIAYNIRSAEWAAEHWTENFSFRVQGKGVDPDAIDPEPAQAFDVHPRKSVATVGDKVLCDQCSLSLTCKFYRTGEVCSLPGSEAAQLATTFKTRDPDTIMDGMSRLMAINARRLEDGLDREDAYGGSDVGAVDPTITNLISSLFDQAGKLAKMIDPKRFTMSPKVVTNVNLPGTPGAGSPQQTLVANIVRELEAEGHARQDITQEMVESKIARMSAIDVPAIEGPDGS